MHKQPKSAFEQQKLIQNTATEILKSHKPVDKLEYCERKSVAKQVIRQLKLTGLPVHRMVNMIFDPNNPDRNLLSTV